MCASPVTTHNSAFLGMYSVDKNFQKRGIGKKLFQSCLEHIGRRNCGLHAVKQELSMYRNKAGFTVNDQVTLVVFLGLPKHWQNLQKQNEEYISIMEYIEGNDEYLTKIIEYDSKVHKEKRSKLLSLTLNDNDINTYVAIDTFSQKLVGYGCIKISNAGKGMIGPLYADNDTIAEVLVYNLINSCIEAQINGLLIQTLSTSLGAIKIAELINVKEVNRCQRIFTKYAIPFNHQYLYCVHSPNFSL